MKNLKLFNLLFICLLGQRLFCADDLIKKLENTYFRDQEADFFSRGNYILKLLNDPEAKDKDLALLTSKCIYDLQREVMNTHINNNRKDILTELANNLDQEARKRFQDLPSFNRTFYVEDSETKRKKTLKLILIGPVGLESSPTKESASQLIFYSPSIRRLHELGETIELQEEKENVLSKKEKELLGIIREEYPFLSLATNLQTNYLLAPNLAINFFSFEKRLSFFGNPGNIAFAIGDIFAKKRDRLRKFLKETNKNGEELIKEFHDETLLLNFLDTKSNQQDRKCAKFQTKAIKDVNRVNALSCSLENPLPKTLENGIAAFLKNAPHVTETGDHRNTYYFSQLPT